jgi:hypothetical protein
MSRSNLSEAHLAQVKEMVKDGKDNQEIIDFMSDQYGVNVKKSCLNSLRHNTKGIKKKVAGRGAGKVKRHYKKRGSPEIVVKSGEDCRLKVICVHAEICVPAVCRYRKG